MNDQQKLKIWEEHKANIDKSTPVDTTESGGAKRARIKRLEAPGNQEEWFAYYFPKYAKKPDGTVTPPAPFHIAASQRVLNNPEFTEVRNWSRECAKSTRTMMDIMYAVLVGINCSENAQRIYNLPARVKKKNILIISNSYDNAERLLQPYMANFEKNNRIINDYGHQVNLGKWEQGEFLTRGGAAFRALGAGQSPRGTRNDEVRPDTLLFDDVDTDADCLNPDIIDKRWHWIEEAAMGTRSVSNPMLIIWCGNIIAEDCCVVRAALNADHQDIINIRDENGFSTWPQKNTEAMIDRVLSSISYAAQQKEYFNNPLSSGKTFPEITWGKCPDISSLRSVMIYSDPAPGNKDLPGQKSGANSSRKATFIVGFKEGRFYVYFGFLDSIPQEKFIQQIFDCRDYAQSRKARAITIKVETNTLQLPYYEAALKPMVARIEKARGHLGLSIDDRKKPDKWTRIEGTLEPINRAGNLIFNEEERGNPHMLRLETQFKTARPTSKELDGPDCIEGAISLIIEKNDVAAVGAIKAIPRKQNNKRL